MFPHKIIFYHIQHITYGSAGSSSNSIKGDAERDFFVELWDVSGHERYKDCRSIFYAQINGKSYITSNLSCFRLFYLSTTSQVHIIFLLFIYGKEYNLLRRILLNFTSYCEILMSCRGIIVHVYYININRFCFLDISVFLQEERLSKSSHEYEKLQFFTAECEKIRAKSKTLSYFMREITQSHFQVWEVPSQATSI